MQIRVEKLREALSMLSLAVPKKTTLPILKHVLLAEGKAIATDMETSIILDLPEVTGRYLIPHNSVAKFLKYVPGYGELVIEVEDKKLTLSCQGSTAAYDVGRIEDYPGVPNVEAEVGEKLDGDMLVGAMSSIARYCSAESSRPVLSGIWLVLGEPMEVAAGDGYRLARQVLPVALPCPTQTVIIPGGAVAMLGALWRKAPRDPSPIDSLVQAVTSKKQIQIGIGNGYLKASFGTVTMVIKLIEGTPPSWQNLVKDISDCPLKVAFLAPVMETAIRRVAEVARSGNNAVTLTWDGGSMTVSAKADEETAQAAIPVNAEGGSGMAAINIGYMLDYLSGKDGLITMALSSESAPILFQYRSFPTVMIMPMHVKD